ncbi:MAG: exodeoxyribonuclease VII large subunit, partial [Pseudomonadota bacterium]|nr:exodeoxyribonuclease VII large subunit [Pseudomonadota bacterium]
IGVITSPSGAVIRDILHRVSDRFPCHVLVWPVRVQGDTCAEEVARAIAGFNALPADGTITRPDVLIVARGGGSLEDLWPFNEEIVARTAAQSEIPLISAVGHETDTTLIDYAADRRAPTPSAAAEMAVPVRGDLQASLADLQGRQLRAQTRRFEQLGAHVTGLARGLPRLEDLLALPRQLLDTAGQRLGAGLSINVGVHRTRAARIATRLTPAILVQRTAFLGQSLRDLERRRTARMAETMRAAHQSVSALSRQLNLLSHESVLQRGFALVTNAEGKAVRRPDDAPAGSDVRILLSGEKSLAAQITDGAETAKPKAVKPKPRQRKAPHDDDAQGELL